MSLSMIGCSASQPKSDFSSESGRKKLRRNDPTQLSGRAQICWSVLPLECTPDPTIIVVPTRQKCRDNTSSEHKAQIERTQRRWSSPQTPSLSGLNGGDLRCDRAGALNAPSRPAIVPDQSSISIEFGPAREAVTSTIVTRHALSRPPCSKTHCLSSRWSE